MNYKKLSSTILFSLALLVPFAPAQAGLWDYAKSALSIPVNHPGKTALAVGAAALYFKGPDLYNAAKAKVNEKIDAFKNSTSAQIAAAAVLATAGTAYYLSRSPMASTGLAGTAAYLLSLRDNNSQPPAPTPPSTGAQSSVAPVYVTNNYYGSYVNQPHPSHIPSIRVHDDGTMEENQSTTQRASGFVAGAVDAYNLAKMTVGQFAENNPTVAHAAKVAAGVAGAAVVATAGYQLVNRLTAPAAPTMAMAAHAPAPVVQQQQSTLFDAIDQNARAQAASQNIKAKEEKELLERAQLAEEHLEYLDKKEQKDTRKFAPDGCSIS